MGDTKIEWTQKTWNPIRGCSVVSEGCRNCYAMNFATRFAKTGETYEDLAYRNTSGAHWTGKVMFVADHLRDPISWRKPQMVFVNSMSDLFHESIPDEWIDRIFGVMGDCSELREHVFQVLTKRPQRMLEYMNTRSRKAWNAPRMNRSSFPPNNIWLGVSVEDQKTADERIPLLMETPAAVRWVSAEPLLGQIDLESVPTMEGSIDWVVVGGESGPGARPMHPDWARSLRNQCVAADVPFFFKQHGEWIGSDQQLADGSDPVLSACEVHHRWPNGKLPGPPHFGMNYSIRVGKKAAGRLLDGREWNEYPQSPS